MSGSGDLGKVGVNGSIVGEFHCLTVRLRPVWAEWRVGTKAEFCWPKGSSAVLSLPTSPSSERLLCLTGIFMVNILINEYSVYSVCPFEILNYWRYLHP